MNRYNKTAIQFLKEEYIYLDEQSISEETLSAMKNYAEYQIKRHLDKAAENAKFLIEVDGTEERTNSGQIHDINGDVCKLSIIKKSITGTPIEL